MTAAAIPDDGRQRQVELLAPLVRLLLNVRAVILLLLSLAAAPGDLKAIGATVLMGATSVLPLLRWRRIGAWVLRHPLAIGIDLVVVAAAVSVVGVDTPLTAYMLSTAVLAGILYGRIGGSALAASMLVAYLVALGVDPGRLSFASTALVPLLLLAGALLGAELRRLFDERDAALQAARSHLIRAATAEERARLAREMHDSVAKTLHGIALSAASVGLIAERDPERAMREVSRIGEAAQVASLEARALLQDLRLDDLSRSFETILHEEVEEFGVRYEVAASVVFDGCPEPEPATRHELLQVVREALHNVAKHADATEVVVRVHADEHRLELAITDDGVGTGRTGDTDLLVRRGHYGIAGVHERALTLGGTAAFRSQPGAGTTVSVTVPVVARSKVPA